MSRDFLVVCANAAQASTTEKTLMEQRAPDGVPLFEVDNRGETLFATLSYPHDIPAALANDVVFVAIKNGRHNGIGYFLDTGARAAPQDAPIPLEQLWQRMVSAF
jgi:hypothetical protein